jgi:DedD protein
MSQQQSALDIEKLREFELRMHYEGVAAFAAGPSPWESWDDAGTLGTWQRLEDHPRHPVRRVPQRTLGQRVLGGVTRLLVLMLLVGIAGVYFSSVTQEPAMVSGIRPAPIVVAKTARATGEPADALANDLVTLPPPSAGDSTRTHIEVVADALPASGAVNLVKAPPATVPALPQPAAVEPKVTTTEATATTHDPANRDDTAPRDTPQSARQEPGTPLADPAPQTDSATRSPEPAADIASVHTSDPALMAEPLAAASLPARNEAEQPAAPSVASGVAATASKPDRQVAMLAEAAVPPAAGVSHTPADPEPGTPPLAASPPTTGDWVVNLASYTRESTAQRMLDKFKDKGVDAEIVTITINDKPMVRIRTSGYQSAKEARDWVPLLEERLGLNGVWISRR